MSTAVRASEIVDTKTRGGDLARRVTSLLLASVGVLIFFLGVRGFARVTTAAFNWAGYIALPLGIFAVMIFLLPLNACVHRLWVAGDPVRRRARLERAARDNAIARLSTAQLRPLPERDRSGRPKDLFPVSIEAERRPRPAAVAAPREVTTAQRTLNEFKPKRGRENGVGYETPPWFAALVLLVSMTGTVLYLGDPSTLIVAVAVGVWVLTGIGLATSG